MAASIGIYTFLRMHPHPPIAAEGLEIESRAGVAGVGLWKTGTRGKRFRVETLEPVETETIGLALVDTYRAAIGAAAAALTFEGESLGNVVVLDVTGDAEAICGASVGTGYSGCECLVIARWELIFV